MDKNKIKSKAKELIKNNLWNLWKPYLIIMVISFVLTFIATDVFHIDAKSTSGSLADAIISFILLPLTTGYITFLLNFVRGKNADIKDIFSQMKNILPIWVVNFVVAILVSIGCVFLIVPGIILGVMFTMTTYLLAEGETNIGDVLSKSASMIKGYKWDYFGFCLSFLGWIVLGVVTLGLGFIYVLPYMNVSLTLYYEELKELQKPKVVVKEVKATKHKTTKKKVTKKTSVTKITKKA